MLLNKSEFKDWLHKPDNIVTHLPSHVELIEFIEDGGQGVVYKGRVNDKIAAIKIYFPGEQLHQRIEREIHALKTIDCSSIVDLLWHSNLKIENYELPIVATSFIAGKTLTQLIKSDQIDWDQLAILTYDVTDAIKCMWHKRIVHRDLKPSNIIIRENGRACVIDLGIARHIDQSTLTMIGMTWGTLGYMSPEQVRAVKQLTCKSDLYSLGIILTECRKGRHLTYGDQLRFMSLDLHEMENLPSQISKWEYAHLVCELLHPRPTKRPQPETILKLLSSYSLE